MTIEKLPSGNYRIKKMIKGKTYRVTVDHKPTKREAEEIIQEQVHDTESHAKDDISFEQATMDYIKVKHNVLAPNTRRGYLTALQRLSEDFKCLSINKLTQIIIQAEISRLSASYAPKTVRNTFGLISAVLLMYRPAFAYNITLPQPKEPDYIMPTSEQVGAIIEAVRGTKYFVPFMLGVCGLRRSEICAATIDDIHGEYIHISKALEHGENGKEIRDNAKTKDSVRDVPLSEEILEAIKASGTIYDGDDTSLWKRLRKEQDRLNIPHFRFHDLRAFYASYAHAHGIPDKHIQHNCGWKTSYTMNKIYKRLMQDEYEKSQNKFFEMLKDDFDQKKNPS